MRSADETAALVFIDIAIIVVVARLIGALCRKIHQPAVIGEIVGGLMLGRSLLGQIDPDLPNRLFPPDVVPSLRVIAQLGLVVFMFIVGLEADVSRLHGRSRAAISVSLGSIVLPLGLGVALALWLHGEHMGSDNVSTTAFALFIGASMSITAFPVLARILAERNLLKTPIGVLSLAAAAVNDIVAWTLLAVVVAMVSPEGVATWRLGVLAVFVVAALRFIPPLVTRVAARFERDNGLTNDVFAAVVVGLLGSAYLTSWVGIHSIFGAFFFGIAMQRAGATAFERAVLARLEQVAVVLLLPVFFIVTGLSADVTNLGGRWMVELPLIIAVACVGKIAGGAVAARTAGLNRRHATGIGVLMNTRGLTELVILDVGLEFGVLDEGLFTMLVIMALVTTVMTDPLLRLVFPRRDFAVEPTSRAAHDPN